jgi:carboxypeptidase Taq
MNPEPAYAELIRRVRDASLLGSCAGLLGWDERTYMPRAGANHRGEQMALLARLGHEMITDPRIGELLAAVEASDLVRDADSDAAANVREIRRGHDRATKLPKELVEELARVTTQAQGEWAEARQASDFGRFRPWLEKIVALKRQEATAVGYTDHPYDVLLDEYEPGAKAADLRRLFADLATDLVPVVERIVGSGKTPERDVLTREFPVGRQERFAHAAAATIGFNFEAGRLDVTTHPFCSGIGPGDTRLTTRYNPRFFNEAFFGVLHEAGHGIYEQNLPAEQFGTPLGAATSLGIHESQSRLWENQVGRSRPFWEHFLPKAREVFPDALDGVSLDCWLFAINDVRPSFIRVEADEATYNLHIILRFEMEQALISGDLQAADVPATWNEQLRRLLGVSPPDDARGCLQDIHWSFGGLGYFPTYTLGNLYAAQLMAAACRDLPRLDEEFRRGEFAPLKDWLTQKIHRHGQRYRANELCRKVTGQTLDHRPFVAYLRAKFEPLYGL